MSISISTPTSSADLLPLIIAGPILRHCDEQHFTLWFVSAKPLSVLSLSLKGADFSRVLTHDEVHIIKLGSHAYQYLIHVSATQLLPVDITIDYQLHDTEFGELFSTVTELGYGESKTPNFIVKPNITDILHGSCRQPHHHSDDALVAADTRLQGFNSTTERPSLLMLSGDQVYVDDVAGPMLYAISQVINLLGLPNEIFNAAAIAGSQDISYQPVDLYQRHLGLLPKTEYSAKTALHDWYVNHAIFTSSSAENHLVSVSEVMALYLLSWSPELWQQISIPRDVRGLSAEHLTRWQKEWDSLLAFKAGLTKVRRLLAHLPTYMIFDDHDVTDDWNLTAKWEEAAYGHAFSKRIIGNALIGYTLFQGLGNNPQQMLANLAAPLANYFEQLSMEAQDELIATLLKYEQWHYTLATSPKLVVLDTRTRRWRSESNLAKPSGLMDWEAMMEFQHELVGQDKVIIVSPAPMYGVKIIETVQRIATMCGASLLVDAENWMAHPGTANTLLSIFMHRKTPQQFVILSGDVHYSFAYKIGIRFRHGGPQIYQITCSGLKNQFPEKLLSCFDKLNAWLYGYYSPLNFFTKRKRMTIRGCKPNNDKDKRLVNHSGIGMVTFAENGAPSNIAVLHSDMTETVFTPPKHD
ncbi:alkaline phosphatase D family protein [Moritella sp. F3]|uniref:alkaline phosphatase D family protein n=1 Tax=Moritella sp. F3 TaxID=2718882 RepID=UPI0018E117BD|nr:alkaline phosphatase D family protein [Moritella sp. F3]GIC77882.1 metallophosphatase-binding domain protein [Moritella sp. F1]GIC82429.1 metallophosphatase-binding domain protein [Moritella sp. F3]